MAVYTAPPSYLELKEKDQRLLFHSTEPRFVVPYVFEEDRDQDRMGSYAYFTVLHGVGLKWWESKQQRDICMERQVLAHQHGLGPEVFGPCLVLVCMWEKGEPEVFWGLRTEVVELPEEKHSLVNNPEYANLRRGLVNLFDTNSLDLHWKNVGWRDSGELVCLDFSFG